METEDQVLAGCPIKPLGLSHDRKFCWYLLADATVIKVALECHSKLTLIAMFGPHHEWLEVNFPLWSRPRFEQDPLTGRWGPSEAPSVIGFDQRKAHHWLVTQCAELGTITPPEAFDKGIPA